MATKTSNLGILLIQPTDYFADVSFNAVINDLDSKVVGIAHLASSGHWDTWKSSAAYKKGDIIRITNTKSNQYYQCITAGTSGTTEPANNVAGSIVTDGTVKWMVYELGVGSSTSGVRLWLGGDYYLRGEIVLYNDALYRCTIDHIAGNTFSADANCFRTICANVRSWSAGIYYRVGEVVVHDNSLYKCNKTHTSSTFSADIANWDLLDSFGLVFEHQLNHEYFEGEMVTVNNMLYRCNTAHTSSTTAFSADVAQWDSISALIPTWSATTYYGADYVVQVQGVMYRCTTPHTSTTSIWADIANWELFPNVTAKIKDWVANTYYEKDQVVYYQGKLYRCTLANNNAVFTPSNWEVVGNGNLNDWKTNYLYTVGDTIVYDKKIYKCNNTHTSTTFIADIANWDEISATRINDWVTGYPYVVGDIVYDNGTIYRCVTAHTSTSLSADIANWELLVAGISKWNINTAYQQGIIVVENNSLYYCNTAHTSTTSIEADIANWDLLGGTSLVPEWKTSTYYFENQLVRQSNTLYRAKTSHMSTTAFSVDTANWENVNAQVQDYVAGNFYKQGEIVIQDNKLWQALRDNSAVNFNQIYHGSGSPLAITVHDAQTGTFTLTTPSVEVIDLGAIGYVTYLTFENYTGSGGQWNNVDVYVSDDNVTYNKLVNVDTTVGGTYTVLVEQDIRYVKFEADTYDDWETGLGSGVPNNVHLQDINVYGSLDWKQLYEFVPPIVRDWKANTSYSTNEIVINDKLIYRVKTPFMSQTTFSDTNLELLDITYLGEWQPNTYYIANECVMYNGGMIRCKTSHTSANTFSASEGALWESVLGDTVIHDWETNRQYTEDTVFKRDNTLYTVNTLHTSDPKDFKNDSANINNVFANIAPYINGRFYKKDETVLYKDNLYQALTDTEEIPLDEKDVSFTGIQSAGVPTLTSTYTMTADLLVPIENIDGITYVTTLASNGLPQPNTFYGVDMVISVSSDNLTYSEVWRKTNFRVSVNDTQAHTTRISFSPVKARYVRVESTVSDVSKIVVASSSTTHEISIVHYLDNTWKMVSDFRLSPWQIMTNYVQNQVCIYNQRLYRCIEAHTSAMTFDTDKFQLLSDIQEWQMNEFYPAGATVVRDACLYYCNIDHTSTTKFTDDLSKSYWTAIGGSGSGIQIWKYNVLYQEDTIVLHDNVPYVCKRGHTSATDFSYDYDKWEAIYANLREWQKDTFYKKNDVVIYNNSLYIANTMHTSKDFLTDVGAVYQTHDPVGEDYNNLYGNLLVSLGSDQDITGILMLQNDQTTTNGASITTVDVQFTTLAGVTNTVTVPVGSLQSVTEKATTVIFKNPVLVNGSDPQYLNHTSEIIIYGTQSCWTSLITLDKIVQSDIDALF